MNLVSLRKEVPGSGRGSSESQPGWCFERSACKSYCMLGGCHGILCPCAKKHQVQEDAAVKASQVGVLERSAHSPENMLERWSNESGVLERRSARFRKRQQRKPARLVF